MVKVILYKQIINKKAPLVPILYPQFGFPDIANTPYMQKAYMQLADPIVEIVHNPKDADFVLLPHDWKFSIRQHNYIENFISYARSLNKKMIIFAHGDNPELIDIPDAYFFLTSQYEWRHKTNEIIMPGHVEDLLPSRKLTLREKFQKPTVSFCGWADLPNLSLKIKSFIKNLRFDLLAIVNFNSKYKHRKQGVFFRKKAIQYLESSKAINTRFIIRTAYSGNVKSAKIDMGQARKEYIDSIRESDYVLTPKGDGNYSLRFYEALSMGRIPILIDTSVVLPLEDSINYDDFVLRIQTKDIPNIANIVRRHYDSLDQEAFISIQKKARAIFEEHLRIDVFFHQIFSGDLLLTER